MDQETKVKCYQSIYAALKNEYGISELGYPDKKDALVFHCKIADDIQFVYSLRMEMDLLMLRVEQEREDIEDLATYAQNISSHFDGMMGTSYDGKIVLMLSVPFAGVTDDVASKLIYEKTLEFVQYIRKELGGLEPPVEEEKEEVEENVKKNPFFQNSSTEEKADKKVEKDAKSEEIMDDDSTKKSQNDLITSVSSETETVSNDSSEEKTDTEVQLINVNS